MVKIRLKRVGRKKQPSYRVVVSDSRKDMVGPYLEAVGFYNPRSNPKDIRFNEERVKHWISKGAQPSPTVHNLLVDQGILESKKVKATKGKPKKEAEQKEEAKKEESKEDAKEEVKDAPAGEKPEEKKEEKPAEETPAVKEETKEEVKEVKEEKVEDKKEEKKEEVKEAKEDKKEEKAS